MTSKISQNGMRVCARALAVAGIITAAAAPARAQGAAAAQPPPQASDPDVRVDPLQPDFTLAALPTTLRMPSGKFAFRVTHRFTRSLGAGNVGDLLSNFFGFDSPAQIGLELRYGLRPGTQIGVHRTNDRTIQIFGQQSVLQQGDSHPFGVTVLATLEGQNNLKEQHSSALGALVSRKVGRMVAIYADPIYVINTNPLPRALAGKNDTLMLGLGGRLRIRPATYLVGEFTPRLAGYRPGVDQISFGLEGRKGGHLFQVNFSNGFGTTMAQLARGGIDNNSWYIGFNISRKFF